MTIEDIDRLVNICLAVNDENLLLVQEKRSPYHRPLVS